MPDSIPSQVVPQAVATQEELPKPEPLVEHQQQEDKQEGEGEGEAPLAPVEQAAVDPIVPSNQLKPRSLTSRPPPLPPPLPTQDKVLPSPSRPTTRSSAQQANPNNTAATSAAQGALDDDDDEGGKSNWVKGTKSRWSPEEDKELLRIIQESPTLSWEDIAGKMEGRKASGCAMRWYNFVRKTVDPAILAQSASTAPAPLTTKKSKTKSLIKGTSGDDGDYDSENYSGEGGPNGDDWVVPEGDDADGGSGPSRSMPHKTKPRHPAVAGLAGSTQGRTIYSARASDASTSADDGTPVRHAVIRGRRTHKPDELEGTLFSPNGKKQKVHSCPDEGCKAAFKRSEHLKRHYRSVHMMQKPYPCEAEDCPKMFSRKDNLQQHMKMVHNVDAPPSVTGSFPACLENAPSPSDGLPPLQDPKKPVPSVLLNNPQLPPLPSPPRAVSSGAGWAAPPPPGVIPVKSTKRGRSTDPAQGDEIDPAIDQDLDADADPEAKRLRLATVAVAQKALEFKTGLPAPVSAVASTSKLAAVPSFNTGGVGGPIPFNTGSVGGLASGSNVVETSGDIQIDVLQNEVDQIFAKAGVDGIDWAGLGEFGGV